MKTEVIMKRQLFGEDISQKSKSEMFSATDLVKAGNKWRVANGLPFFNMNQWFAQNGTKQFVKELERRFGTIKIPSRGRNHHTWVHPMLFIDMALAISPSLKIEVYQWLYDHLIRYRNDSGDSYNLMCGALYRRTGNKTKFPEQIKKLAKLIQLECGVQKDWQNATEEQLDYRDKIQRNIALLAEVLDDPKEAVRIGIKKTREAKERQK